MTSPTLNELFPGPTELADLMRRTDWSTTSLGPPDSWPQSLKTIVRVLLTSRFAMWMGWGPELTFFYNDAYAAMTLGAKITFLVEYEHFTPGLMQDVAHCIDWYGKTVEQMTPVK